MYNNTELCVKTDKDTMTGNFTSNIGARQGVYLRTTLFKIFINDLIDSFDESLNLDILLNIYTPLLF
jgi:hypothetical protein